MNKYITVTDKDGYQAIVFVDKILVIVDMGNIRVIVMDKNGLNVKDSMEEIMTKLGEYIKTHDVINDFIKHNLREVQDE